MHSDRDVRQRDLVPAGRLSKIAFMVIGVGAIGRQVATLLAAMGAQRITLVDDDTVGTENLAVQGYRPEDLGKPKVEVLRDFLLPLNPGVLRIRAVQRKYLRGIQCLKNPDDELVTFCCVDNIAARKFIWNQIRADEATSPSLWVDGRMAAETLRILTWWRGQPPEQYDQTLFESHEAFQAPCTGRTTLYSSYVVSGMMVGEFVKWLREQFLIITKDQIFNMMVSELSVQT